MKKEVADENPDQDGRHLSSDVKLLLTEISKEPVPERLLALARQLQAALNRNHPAKS